MHIRSILFFFLCNTVWVVIEDPISGLTHVALLAAAAAPTVYAALLFLP